MAKGPNKNRDKSDPGQPVVCRAASPRADAGSQRRPSVQQNDTPIRAGGPEAPSAPPHHSGRLTEVILRLAGLVGRQIAREQFERKRSPKS